MAQYEARFTELSRFASQLISTKENKALNFQDGLKPYLKNKTSILKLSVYSKVVDKALIAEKDVKELHQYREQQRKRGRSDSAHGSHVQNKPASSRNHSRGKAVQNSNIVCPSCGKRHGSKRLVLEKLKEDSKEDRQKPRAQGRVFSMTHRDA